MQSTIHCFRWYGPNDTVSLKHIAQAGCTGVVSALHAYAPGEIWPLESITAYRQHIEAHSLTWEVVESLPVHDHIKLGYPDRDALIENYRISLRNLAEAGVRTVTYNFMPLLDWLRTDVAYVTPVGSEVLYFNRENYALFDLFILQRECAANEYQPEELARLQTAFHRLTEAQLQKLKTSLLTALPGTSENFTLDYLREKLREYKSVSRSQLQQNLVYFLQKITPLADELGIRLTIHPDDPPFPVFGLPRVVSTAADCHAIFSAVPNPSNGLCFCTGSFGARPDNHLVSMLETFGPRVHFLHLRNTKMLENGDFYEADHLAGDADMYRILEKVKALAERENRKIPMRPDHGAKMLDDLGKDCYPGYSAIGRLKGLAELRGVEYALHQK
jgi:mannonate dehydratase